MNRTVRMLQASALVLSAACSKSEAPAAPAPAPAVEQAVVQAPSAQALREKAKALFGTLPAVAEHKDRPITEEKVALGRVLYHETRISKNHDLSCATCHALDAFGIDSRPDAVQKGTSAGHKGAFGDRNTPTVFNAAIQVAQFWDGREPDVEAQAKGPVLNPVEMAMADDISVVGVLESIPGYAPLFKAAFPDAAKPITYDNFGAAIGAFERKLMTPGPIDAFLAGKDDALTEQQLRGLDTFITGGCIACHSGPGFGGSMFQKLGLIKPYPTKDEGRFKVTKNEADKYFFKVPTLRNVAKTAPYFHDGSVKTLAEAVAIMSEHQTATGRLPDDKIADVVAFLGALTGEPDPSLIKVPELPESGPKTPKPDPN